MTGFPILHVVSDCFVLALYSPLIFVSCFLTLRVSLYYITAPTAPQRPQAFCQVVVWEEPEHTNGIITKYLVKYLAVSREVSGDRNSFVLPTELPSGTVIRVCVFL